MVQPMFATPTYAHSNAPPSSFTHPIRIQTTGYGGGGGPFGISAPASLNLYTSSSTFVSHFSFFRIYLIFQDNFGAHQADEEGIWA
jgi:hypothetical protein